MPISLRQLEIFEKVAETGSVTRAGELLLLTQSAVSMAVSQLEQQSATPLFERSGRRLLLNHRGRQFLKQAREILRSVRRFEQELQGAAGELTGELLIGGSTTIANYLLPAILGAFSQQYPKTVVKLRVGNTQQIADWLEAGDIDIAFVEGPCHSMNLSAVHWRDDELVVLAGPQHSWAEKKKVTPAMLSRAPWIMREKGSGTREIFEGAMEKAGIRFTITLELGHTEAIKSGIAAGLGVGCLSRAAVRRELEHGVLIELKSPLSLSRSLTLLKRQGSFLTALLAAFLEIAGGKWEIA